METKTVKRYRLLTGAIISAFIAMLAFLPQVVQEHTKDSGMVMAINLFTIFLYSFLCWIFNGYLIVGTTQQSLLRKQTVKLLVSFIFAFFISYVLLYLVRDHFGRDTVFSMRQFYGRRHIVGVVVFRGSFVNAFLYFIAYVLELNTQNQQATLENERLKHENLEARLHVLHQQLSPHFLFNSLGILNTITPDPSVHKYIIQLSNIYRYLLTPHEGHMAELEREVNFINAYLYVIKERFEDALQVSLNIDDVSLKKKLPPAALQLLIENAIKHNVVSLEEPLTIQIFTDYGFLIVQNSFNPRLSDSPGEGGIGLHNIAERYALLSGREIVIEKTEYLFTVKLPLI